MVVSGAELAITGAVSSVDRPLIEEGLEVELDDPTLDISIRGTIDFIADNTGGPDVASDRFRIRVVPNNEVPEDAYNQNLRMVIPISSTGGEVLAVPLAALSAGADGATRVEVERATGETELVTVTVGLSASGFAQVEPTTSSLEVGDRVVVGRDNGSSTDGDEASDEDDAESDDS